MLKFLFKKYKVLLLHFLIVISLILFFTYLIFRDYYITLWNLFFVWSILLMIIGTFGAMFQKKIINFLAYTTLNHIGFILMTFFFEPFFYSLFSFILYLIIYLITIFTLYFIILNLKTTTRTKIIYLKDLQNLFKINPILAFCFTINLLSLAGVPPLAGFYSKYCVFLYCTYLQAFIIIVVSFISFLHYLKIIKIIFFEKSNNNNEFIKPSFINYFIIIVLTYYNVFFFYTSISLILSNIIKYFI